MKDLRIHIISFLLALLPCLLLGQEVEGFIKPSHPAGFYAKPFVLQLHTPPHTQIFFTIDGATPSIKSKPYTKPLYLANTVVIKAILVGENHKQLASWVATYFIEEPKTTFLTVSLAIPPRLLFDANKGLFQEGNNAADTTVLRLGANFWSRAEFPSHLELFEPDGKQVFSSPIGFRMFGGFSRTFPQKSISLMADKNYGASHIDYPIFGKGNPKKFKSLVLRNSGSDFGKTHFRDALMQSLVSDWGLEHQAYRPAHVYINGHYWGIYNIREKINKYFLNAHHDIDKDSIDFIEHRAVVKQGSINHYQHLLHFMQRNKLSIQPYFDYVATQMDVRNFLDYQVAQIYFDNQDAGGNIKFWRPQTPQGKWRWILFDTDWGFGLNDANAFQNNSLAFHTEPNGPEWPNPAWSTFILRKLLENEGFRQQFVNRFADRLNTSFSEEYVLKRINGFHRLLVTEIPRHNNRWQIDQSFWEQQVKVLRNFAQHRPEYVRMHLMDFFKTGNQVAVELQTSPGGKIVLNDNLEVRRHFEGIYFQHIPIQLAAVADYGYRFSHWEGWAGKDAKLTLDLTYPVQLKAVFVPYLHPLAQKIVINEISPNHKQSGDWIELFNASKERIRLANWKLTDLKNEFILPDVAIDPSNYLVICEDSTKFLKAFPNAYHFISGLSFGISKHKERIQLFAEDGALVDSIYYHISPFDSTFTLSLLLPHLDNANLNNWNIRLGEGTPNEGNPYYIQSSVRAKQGFWLQIGAAISVLMICILWLLIRAKNRQQLF